MLDFSSLVAGGVFIAVIALIMTEKIHLTVAALLGSLVLVFAHIMTLGEAVDYISRGHVTLGLFFGVMVLVRAFEPTNIFAYLATKIVLWSKGRGNYLLLGIIGITAPICAILPNATTVTLLAPLIPPLAEEIGVNFVPLIILMVIVSNSAGLLTLVGDPATFIVGDSINMSFFDYLISLSWAGVLAVVTVVVMTPFLFKEIWHSRFTNFEQLPIPKINHPRVLSLGALIMLFVLLFFIFGDLLPIPLSPAAVALMGATLALLLAHQSKIDTVQNILRDVDWSTLIFFMSVFVLIGGLEKTGVISQISVIFALLLGQNIFLASLVLVFAVGALSSVIPNIPLVVAMIPLLKEYLFNAGLIGGEVLQSSFSGNYPPVVLPLFFAMMFGATLGGNATLVGASANIVGAGVAELHGKTISYGTFLRYGLPIAIAQLTISALYITIYYLLKS
ncbi:putative tyrosine transporter P-protein [Cyanobacterium stanieri PCC 7202]|uniref:Tyrosine transporter P-protein n=1 Tax=Cyanobacterium stanieri (strain ATCC 29140 / PCC 7202) TaxID=292563 RepID=K9YLG5_CYASC|nr:putative tyrosine transporter P-protein [Cyanobacterium stanieri PCC 7202]